MKTLRYGSICILSILIVSAGMLNGCGDDEPLTGPGESSSFYPTKVVLSMARLNIYNEPTTEQFTATWTDADGAGGSAPEAETIILTPDARYSCTIEILNELDAPTVDIADTVALNANEFQLFYEIRGDADDLISIGYMDKDGNDLPIGLDVRFEIDDAQGSESGTLSISLSHYQRVTKNGSREELQPEFDIEFPVTVSG